VYELHSSQTDCVTTDAVDSEVNQLYSCKWSHC